MSVGVFRNFKITLRLIFSVMRGGGSQERSNQGESSGVVSVRTFFAAAEMLAPRSE